MRLCSTIIAGLPSGVIWKRVRNVAGSTARGPTASCCDLLQETGAASSSSEGLLSKSARFRLPLTPRPNELTTLCADRPAVALDRGDPLQVVNQRLGNC